MFVPGRSSLRPAPREWKGIAGALIIVLSASVGTARAQGAKPGEITAVNHLKVRPTRQLSDAEIAERVRNALTAHTLVDRYQIGVRVEGSEVQLLGQVESQLEKETAEWIAAGISGVMSVENDIRVETPIVSKTDPELQEDVKSQFFWSPFVDGEDIRVTADRGVVTLSGKVDSWTEYRSATENAVEAGAVGVINRLDVVTGA